MNLQQYNNDGFEVFINPTTGETFASIKGYARMSNKVPGTIRKRLQQGGQKWNGGKAQIQTAGGIQGGQLITEDFIAHWLPKDNPEMATQVLKLGVRVFLQAIANYKQPLAQPTGDQLALELQLQLTEKQLELEACKQYTIEMAHRLGVSLGDIDQKSGQITKTPDDFPSEAFAKFVFEWIHRQPKIFNWQQAAEEIGWTYPTLRNILVEINYRPKWEDFCKFAAIVEQDSETLYLNLKQCQ